MVKGCGLHMVQSCFLSLFLNRSSQKVFLFFGIFGVCVHIVHIYVSSGGGVCVCVSDFN